MTTSIVFHLLGRLHPAVVHFPIALITVAAILESWQILRRKPGLAPATAVCLVLGAISGVAASVFGWLLDSAEGGGGNVVELHRWIGIASAVVALVAMFLIVPAAVSPKALMLVRALVFLGAALVGATGYLGGELVFGTNHLVKNVFKEDQPLAVATGDGPAAKDREKPPPAAQKIAFHEHIAPVLKEYCLRCHGGEKVKGKYSVKTYAEAVKGGTSGEEGIVAGKPEKSSIYTKLVTAEVEDRMPPKKEKQMTKEQIELIKRWIAEGAVWPEDVALDK